MFLSTAIRQSTFAGIIFLFSLFYCSPTGVVINFMKIRLNCFELYFCMLYRRYEYNCDLLGMMVRSKKKAQMSLIFLVTSVWIPGIATRFLRKKRMSIIHAVASAFMRDFNTYLVVTYTTHISMSQHRISLLFLSFFKLTSIQCNESIPLIHNLQNIKSFTAFKCFDDWKIHSSAKTIPHFTKLPSFKRFASDGCLERELCFINKN